MKEAWGRRGYTPKQADALNEAEAAAENHENQPLTRARWDELAEQAYDPSLEPEEFRGAKDTKQVYSYGKSERWRLKRTKTHWELIDDVVDEKPGKEEPTLTILGGGPASGKSFLRVSAISEYPEAVVIDPDEFKLKLPEFERFLRSDPLRAAARVHEESSYLAKWALDEALDRKNDIILDMVNGQPSKLAELVERAKQFRIQGEREVCGRAGRGSNEENGGAGKGRRPLGTSRRAGRGAFRCGGKLPSSQRVSRHGTIVG